MKNYIPTSCFADFADAIVKSAPKLMSKFNSVIIVAAGNGTRMGNICGKTKQFIELCGIPVVIRSVLAFENCDFINEIIIVAKNEEIGDYDFLLPAYGIKKAIKIVKGGATRQKSVMNGLSAVSPKSDYLAIHDAARCLVTGETIRRTFEQAYIYGAAAAGTKMTDTVKKSDNSGFAKETLDRSMLWCAQTPQIFKTDLYRAAGYIAERDDIEVTDDCMLAESIGFGVKLVECGSDNIKLTTPTDIAIAEAILKMRASARNSE